MSGSAVVVVTRHRVGAAGFDGADAALAALAQRPGFVRGSVLHAVDEPDLWALLTEWVDLGSWRRALSAGPVKLAATPVLAGALDEPTTWATVRVIGTAVPPAAATDRLGG